MSETSIAAQIAKLQAMTVGQLREEYERVFSEEARSRNKTWLWRRIAWRLQELEYGGLSDLAKHRLEELMPDAELALRVPRTFPRDTDTVSVVARRHPVLKPGSALIRNYRDERHVVIARDDGQFEWRDRVFRSLSAVANAITGSHVSGPAFFNLKQKIR